MRFRNRSTAKAESAKSCSPQPEKNFPEMPMISPASQKTGGNGSTTGETIAPRPSTVGVRVKEILFIEAVQMSKDAAGYAYGQADRDKGIDAVFDREAGLVVLIGKDTYLVPVHYVKHMVI